MLGQLWRRLRILWQRDRFERELEEEMRLHLQLRAEKIGDRAARQQFGNTTLLQEDSRKQWKFAWLETSLQDLRHALRSLGRRPGFSAAVIGTLGLGLGLNTAFFTVLNTFVLRPMAVRDPYSLYQVGLQSSRSGEWGLSTEALHALRERTDVFSEVLATRDVYTNLEGRVARGAIVTENYFSMLGGRIAMGRLIQSDDREAVMVLSDRAWRQRFAADQSIVGRSLMIGKHRLIVIGVAAPEFEGLSRMPDFWAPMEAWRRTVMEISSNLGVVGRFRQGMTVVRAKTALESYAKQLGAHQPERERAWSVELRSRATLIEFPARAYLLLLPLMVAFAVTMAMPCANVANMMLARGLARQREIGVRLSLGAGRSRLIRQLLTEGLVLSIAAGLFGMLIAQAALAIAVRVAYDTSPLIAGTFLDMIIPELAMDWRVFLWVLGISVMTTFAFGLAPALQATRMNIASAIHGGFESMRASSLRNALVVAQVAIALFLLSSAGLLLRGFDRLIAIDRGFDDRGVYSLADFAQIQVPKVVSALRQEPWAGLVAHGAGPPDVLSEAVVTPAGQEASTAEYSFISPEYLAMFRIPLLRGRSFTEDEAAAGAAVALVSYATAERFWPGREPLGQALRLEPSGSRGWRAARLLESPEVLVIGVTKDVITGAIPRGVAKARIYLPAKPGESRAVFVRGTGDARQTARLFGELWRRIAAPDDAAEVYAVEDRRFWDMYPMRAMSWVASLLGLIALLLTISGIYGVMSYLVSQRTKEIGIRLALGATRLGIVRHVLEQSAKVVLIGSAVGLLVAAALSRVIRASVLPVAFDPLVFGIALLFVGFAAAAASVIPARRALRIDPARTLRAE